VLIPFHCGQAPLADQKTTMPGQQRTRHDDPVTPQLTGQHAGNAKITVSPANRTMPPNLATQHRDLLAQDQDLTGIDLPEGHFTTLTGFIISQLSRTPEIGDSVETRSWLSSYRAGHAGARRRGIRDLPVLHTGRIARGLAGRAGPITPRLAGWTSVLDISRHMTA
jgi:hypothetical protein